MANFGGILNLGTSFGINLGTYPIDVSVNYANKTAMVIDTMMKAGLALFQQAEVSRNCGNRLDAETATKKACAMMNTLSAWKTLPHKRPPECPTSWLDDAWCTLHAKYEELQEKEVC